MTTQPKISDDIKSLVDLISKTVTIIAVAVGGWWTYSNFVQFKESAENLSLRVQATTSHVATGKAVAIIDVSMKNIGKVSIIAGRSIVFGKGEDAKEHGGCEITVIEYDIDSAASEDKVKIIDWDQQGIPFQTIVDHHNLLGGYASFEDGTYELNPGVEYHEPMAFSVRSGKLYGVRARFFSSHGWSISDIKYFHVNAV